MLSSRAGGCLVATMLCLVGDPGAGHAATISPGRIPSIAGPLTLERALALAARYPSRLRAADLRASAAKDRIRDSGRLPSPTLVASAENFGGGLGSRRLESTVELAQPLELGGDRGARVAVAAGEYRVAAAEAAVLRRELLALTAERYISAWSLQARIHRLREGEALTRQAIVAASQRYRAGASPLLERTRAESQALAQGVERQRAEAELWIARRELALSWGGDPASFDTLIAEPLDPRSGDTDGAGTDPPDLERAAAGEALATARIREARASRIPDLSLSVGIRHLEEVGGTGFVAALEVPLPLWNRGRGNAAAARQEHEAALAERRAVAERLEAEAANANDRLRAASAAYDSLRLRVRPARQELLRELLRAYHSGRLNYLDLVTEQRNLLETDLAVIDAEADLWRSRVRLELLTGARPGREDVR